MQGCAVCDVYDEGRASASGFGREGTSLLGVVNEVSFQAGFAARYLDFPDAISTMAEQSG